MRPSFAKNLSLCKQRAQGRPGAGRTHGPPASKKAGGSHHRFGRTTGLPCAMALRLISRSPWGPGFLAPIAARSQASHDLVSASGDQDHAALPYVMMPLVWQPHRVHRISSPTFVTIAKRPSCGPGWREISTEFWKTEANFLCRRFDIASPLNGRANFVAVPKRSCPVPSDATPMAPRKTARRANQLQRMSRPPASVPIFAKPALR